MMHSEPLQGRLARDKKTLTAPHRHLASLWQSLGKARSLPWREVDYRKQLGGT